MKPVVRSFVAKKETVQQDWLLCDASGEVVGRLATRIATILMGKHKPIYTPHVDCGDFVVVVNCEKVKFSGRTIAHPTNPNFTTKMAKKEYDWFTGYPGGRHTATAADWLETHPERILREAVRRMLPKNKLGRQMLTKLKLFVGPNHTHQAQQPQPLPEYLK